MSPKNEYVLDRIEGSLGVFEDENGRHLVMNLPEGASEGDIFRLEEGKLIFMPALTARRREEMKKRLSRLFSEI